MTLPAADPAIASAPPPRFPAADWRAVHLLALLVAIAACWAARELVVPVLLGLFLALVANPIVRRLERIRVPRWIGAFFVVIGGVLYRLVGVVAFDEPTQMLAPPLLYLGLQLIESELVTPIVLGRRWSISPLVVLLWLLFCGWLWGIAGVLLAVPMLVCFKIVAERVPDMDGWAAVIE